ncbi:MAG: hypothetical protein HOY79_47330 [Streptomyces sp.]|nr:hypothetical protein [Streptomyces sp.]
MSVADKARKVVQNMTGMWWPDADEDGLREAARAWRAFAEDVEDIQAVANKAARALIEDNKGESIDAFDKFWRRYYDHGRGWLKDVPDAARDMAKSLDAYADAVHGAKKHLEHELEIVGATLVAGTALAVFTAGLSEGAAAAAAVTVTELAASLGAAVTEEIATIAGTTLVTAAFGGVESVTVDLAVAQPTAIALGEQKDGINLDEASQAGVYGALTGGLLGGAAGGAKAIAGAGGWRGLLGGAHDVPGLELSSAGTPIPGQTGGAVRPRFDGSVRSVLASDAWSEEAYSAIRTADDVPAMAKSVKNAKRLDGSQGSPRPRSGRSRNTSSRRSTRWTGTTVRSCTHNTIRTRTWPKRGSACVQVRTRTMTSCCLSMSWRSTVTISPIPDPPTRKRTPQLTR